MSFPITKSSVGFAWVATLAAALWLALGTSALAAWIAVLFIALMPASMLIVMANTPPKSMAEIIRDVETGRSL